MYVMPRRMICQPLADASASAKLDPPALPPDAGGMFCSDVMIVLSPFPLASIVGFTCSYGKARAASMMSRVRLVAPLRAWLRSVSAFAVLSIVVVARTPSSNTNIAIRTSMIVKPDCFLREPTRFFTGGAQLGESNGRQPYTAAGSSPPSIVRARGAIQRPIGRTLPSLNSANVCLNAARRAEARLADNWVLLVPTRCPSSGRNPSRRCCRYG